MGEIFTQTLLFKLPRVKLLVIIVTNKTETMIMSQKVVTLHLIIENSVHLQKYIRKSVSYKYKHLEARNRAFPQFEV